MPLKAMKTKLKRDARKCKNFKQCGRKAKSIWAAYCGPCFLAQAASSGARSSGNANGKGSPGNAGNKYGKGSPGNAGNPYGKGSQGNAGNKTNGLAKKPAGIRSGVRRSARTALVVRKRWLDQILAGKKTWEIPRKFQGKSIEI